MVRRSRFRSCVTSAGRVCWGVELTGPAHPRRVGTPDHSLGRGSHVSGMEGGTPPENLAYKTARKAEQIDGLLSPVVEQRATL
jgi:hypothetical protein